MCTNRYLTYIISLFDLYHFVISLISMNMSDLKAKGM